MTAPPPLLGRALAGESHSVFLVVGGLPAGRRPTPGMAAYGNWKKPMLTGLGDEQADHA